MMLHHVPVPLEVSDFWIVGNLISYGSKSMGNSLAMFALG